MSLKFGEQKMLLSYCRKIDDKIEGMAGMVLVEMKLDFNSTRGFAECEHSATEWHHTSKEEKKIDLKEFLIFFAVEILSLKYYQLESDDHLLQFPLTASAVKSSSEMDTSSNFSWQDLSRSRQHGKTCARSLTRFDIVREYTRGEGLFDELIENSKIVA